MKGESEVDILTYILVNSKVVLVEPRKRISMCRDPDNDKFLEIAYEAKTDYLVTLDKDLPELYFITFRGRQSENSFIVFPPRLESCSLVFGKNFPIFFTVISLNA